MIIDPSDTICDSVSPMKDLESRVEVQIQLWNNVYNLRSGKFYEHSSIDFMTYIDKCKTSPVDNPDLIYLSDEGVILKRLFSIFAFRPITIQSIPILGILTPNPLNFPVNMLSFTTIPYITHKIIINEKGDEPDDSTLEDAFQQANFYIENGTYVPKITKFISCNGPLIFYVPRRSLRLPMSISQRGAFFNIVDYGKTTLEYQGINKISVRVDPIISLSDAKISYYLKSAVIFDLHLNNDIILGHFALLFNISDVNIDIEPCHIYNPRNGIKDTHPIRFSTNYTTAVNIQDLVNTRGSIFIYDKQ